jgi:uncharacterized protein
VIADEPELAAGDFSAWIVEIQAAIRGEGEADVPCGGCTACCTSSQFVHIGRDETDTLAHIPAELLFPAPRMPRGHVLLGYDEQGHCPMLIDDTCSIYEHRPRTCRTYDCRVFPATGVELDDDDKVLIALQARRWRFSFSGGDRQYEAAHGAAKYLQNHADGPTTSTQLAVTAIELHDEFLNGEPDPQIIQVMLTCRSRSQWQGDAGDMRA